MNRAFLSLGSNIGDKQGWLCFAVARLSSAPGIKSLRKSPLYRSEPWGYNEQPPFLNAVLAVETDLAPLPLLRLCQSIEQEAGRQRELRWGPRTLDIDIISIDNTVLHQPPLILPHPRYAERRFVLEPLAALLQGENAPPLADIEALLADLPPQPAVEMLLDATGW